MSLERCLDPMAFERGMRILQAWRGAARLTQH
jgi:hypothetical protein